MLSKRSNRKKHKRHGFLTRMKTKTGKNVINARRSKGRKRMGQ